LSNLLPLLQIPSTTILDLAHRGESFDFLLYYKSLVFLSLKELCATLKTVAVATALSIPHDLEFLKDKVPYIARKWGSSEHSLDFITLFMTYYHYCKYGQFFSESYQFFIQLVASLPS